jgi:hypothetical protein
MNRHSEELEDRRDRFAADFDELRAALHQELGWAPRGMRWIVPIVALAAGIAVGVALRRNLPRLRGGGAPSRPGKQRRR